VPVGYRFPQFGVKLLASLEMTQRFKKKAFFRDEMKFCLYFYIFYQILTKLDTG
jgi:hypothetical protein